MHMERLSDARLKIDEARSVAQQAQSERVKAAGSLLKRLSFSDSGSKPPNDPDSLPNSPTRMPSSSKLPPVTEVEQKSVKPTDPFWNSVISSKGEKTDKGSFSGASSKSSVSKVVKEANKVMSVIAESPEEATRQSSKTTASINRSSSKSKIGSSVMLSSGSDNEEARKSTNKASVRRVASNSKIGSSVMLSSGSEDGDVPKSNKLAASIKRSKAPGQSSTAKDPSSEEDVPRSSIERRASLMDILSTARKTAAEIPGASIRKQSIPTTPEPVQADPIPVSPQYIDPVHDTVMLKRGEACHCFLLVLQRLNIPSDVALMRVVLKRWRKPDLQVLRAKLSPIVSWGNLKIAKMTASAFWRFQIFALPLRHQNKNGQVVEYRERSMQTEARRQFDHVLGLGKLSRIVNDRVNSNLRTFYHNLRANRKKQMEIAFLRAVIAELKRREL